MKRLLVTGILIASTLVSAAESSHRGQPPGTDAPEPQVWLGMDVHKPDDSTKAQLPNLPPGIGFVVSSVEPEGPAEAAGLKRFDVLWKLDDQMLINEGQFAVLLRLSKPGDEILLSGFRGGKPLEVKVNLAERPEGRHPFPGNFVDSAIMPGKCEGPMRVIKLSEKLASFSASEGEARVWLEDSAYHVRISGPDDKLIYEGKLPSDGNLDGIPKHWTRRVHALRRGLSHALDGKMMSQRQPRPRVVPPAVTDQ